MDIRCGKAKWHVDLPAGTAKHPSGVVAHFSAGEVEEGTATHRVRFDGIENIKPPTKSRAEVLLDEVEAAYLKALADLGKSASLDYEFDEAFWNHFG